MKYKEPVKKEELEFKLVKLSDLKIHEYQRDLSSGLVSKLANSLWNGFIMPLIVNKDMEILDGQHRYIALKEKILNDENPEVPVIVVPGTWEEIPLYLNIEKGDNVKDKCTKLYKLYMDKFMDDPSLKESELNPACQWQPYLWTLAFAYVEGNLPSPSLVETTIKKFDGGLDLCLDESIDIRRSRAEKVCRLADLVNEIASENGFRDFNLKKAVLTKSTSALWGRSRTLGLEFDQAIQELEDQISMTDWSGFAR